MKVNNVPAYAFDHDFIIARMCDDELWFYGAYNDDDNVDYVVHAVDGIVIPIEMVA